MSSDYNENSLDSKITRLVVQYELDAKDRAEFRTEILERLKSIETQVLKTNGRVTKLEESQKVSVEACVACRKEIAPIIEAATVAKGTWFSVKNVLLGISFLSSTWATIVAIRK